MTENIFLAKILEFAKSYKNSKGVPLFIPKKIMEIDTSCCKQVTIEVIDFDKTKEFLSAEHKLKNLKSCDALLLLPDKNRIDFIEFKGFEEFKKWQLSNRKPESHEALIKKQITSFELKQKLDDSLFLLSFITKLEMLEMTTEERRMFEQSEVRYIILVDIEISRKPTVSFAFTADFLATPHANQHNLMIETHLKGELEGIESTLLVQKPLVLNCEQIVEFYKDLAG